MRSVHMTNLQDAIVLFTSCRLRKLRKYDAIDGYASSSSVFPAIFVGFTIFGDIFANVTVS